MTTLVTPWSYPYTVPPLPPNSSPMKLEHAEQLELGYMPLRDEFDVEFDNDAETTISTLSIAPDDDEVEHLLKLTHIDFYRRRLRERGNRKQ